MAQYDFGTLVGTESGITLATALNSWIPAILSQHKGNAAPSYAVGAAQAGLHWLYDVSAAGWVQYVFDGTDWIKVYKIDTTNNLHLLDMPTDGQRLVLPQASSPAPTAAGELWMSSSTNLLHWGDGTNSLKSAPNQYQTISKGTSGSVASLTWTGLSAYRKLRLRLVATPATNAVNLWLRTSTNNGSSYDAGASDYTYAYVYANFSAQGSGHTTQTGVGVNTGVTISNTGGVISVIEMSEFNKATYGRFIVQSRTDGTTVDTVSHTGAHRLQATARDAFQLIMSSGNISSCVYHLEGIKG